MHISVAGKLGSGKSTICTILKNKYGYQIYSTGVIHREIANQQKVSTLEMNRMMTKDLRYDREIDEAVTKISIEKDNEVIIFDSRMAWKFAAKSFKIFVSVDPLVAATRVMKEPRGVAETYSDIEDARLKLIERARIENERFKQLYDIDNFDYSNYNLIIDSTYVSPEDMTNIVYDKYQKYCNNNYEETSDILMSPTSLFPLESIRSIHTKILDEYKTEKEYNKRPIEIVVANGYHFIVDGHHRMLAAVLNKEEFVNVKVASTDKYTFLKTENNLLTEAQSLGLSTVYDFEEIGDFKYSSYPDHYIR